MLKQLCIPKPLLLALLCAGGNTAHALDLEQQLTLSQRSSFTESELTENKQSAHWKLNGYGNFDFTIIARSSYNHYYKQNEFDGQTVNEHVSESEVREAYVDFFMGDVSARIGKQQVTWGESDYFRVLDVINPLDLKEFLLSYTENYQQARYGLNMVNINHQGENWESQLLYIPDFKATVLPSSSADFAPNDLKLLVSQLGQPQSKEPDADINKPAWAMSSKTTFNWGDMGFYGYQGWDSTGVVSFNGAGAQIDYYERTMAGLSVSYPIDNWILRSDYSRKLDEKLAVNFSSGQTFSQHDVDTWLIGADYNFASSNISLQWLQNRIANHNPILTQKKSENEFSIYASQQFMGDRLTVSNLIMATDVDDSALSETRLAYRFTDHLTVDVGFDWFIGSENSFYGQYKEQSRLFGLIRYFL